MICETVPMEDEVGGLRYRYWLHRDLSAAGGQGLVNEGLVNEGLVFVMLNPSTADEVDDDPSVRRCMAFGRRWGYRELTVVNLFALRATRPDDLRRHGGEAVGERNDEVLRWARQHPATSVIVAAWGNHGTHLNRDAAVMPIIRPAMALRITKPGHPAHPLYLPLSARPVPYEHRRRSVDGGALPGAPVPVRRALSKLGDDVRDARRRRRIPMALLAERASISRTTLANIEKGDAGVSLGNYARALFSLGLLDRLADLADARHDDTGLAIERERLPQRIRRRRLWR